MANANTLHTVLALIGDRRVDQAFNVPRSDVFSTAEEFRSKHGVEVVIEVDGHNLADAAIVAPRQQPTTAIAQTIQSDDHDINGVELAHHMLWESYKRASQIQAFSAEKMQAQQAAMTESFCKQMEGLRAQYATALEKIDAHKWETKMMEQERAYNHLSTHHRQMAEDVRRDQERRENDAGTIVKKLVVGALGVIEAIGKESNKPPSRGGGSHGPN